MEKKIRIQKFTPEYHIIDDRMVSQDPEFSKGPQMQHDGPLRIEFSLFDKEDIDKCKAYLDQLAGILPVETKPMKKVLKVPQIPEVREQLLKDALEAGTDQDKLIQYLREHDFKFLTYEHIATFPNFALTIKDEHTEKFQWMLRKIKEGKDPANDKYDPSLAFGIKLIDERIEFVKIYLDGSYHSSVKIPLPTKPRETFKKSGMMKFPPYMTPEERERFRYEVRQYQLNPNKDLSKFFNRWREYVENCPALPQDTVDDKKVSD